MGQQPYTLVENHYFLSIRFVSHPFGIPKGQRTNTSLFLVCLFFFCLYFTFFFVCFHSSFLISLSAVLNICPSLTEYFFFIRHFNYGFFFFDFICFLFNNFFSTSIFFCHCIYKNFPRIPSVLFFDQISCRQFMLWLHLFCIVINVSAKQIKIIKYIHFGRLSCCS